MSVADILEQMAQNAGRARLTKGGLIGQAISDLSLAPGQIQNEHERQAIFNESRARQRAADARATAQDARQTAKDAQDEKARQDAEQHVAVVNAGLTAAMGDSGDPNQFDAKAAFAAVSKLGKPEAIRDVIAAHRTMAQKYTAGAPGSVMRDENGQVVPGSQIPEKPPAPSLAGFASTVAAGGPDAPQAQAALDLMKPPPTQKNVQSESFLLDGKPVKGVFDPTAGTYLYNGQDVTARVRPIPPASTIVNAGGVDNVKEAVAGMKDGTLPPQMPGRASKDYTATLAEARRQGFDLAKANLDWTATMKHIASMNGAQQLRLNQAINALPDMLDKVDALASQWKGGRFPLLNKANLTAAKGGFYGKDVASVATQLDAQIADVTADLGNVYMGGNSPTDHALGLAGKSLKGEWDEKVLHDMVKLAKTNVTIRSHSIAHTGVAGASDSNPYASQPGPDMGPPATTIRARDPQGVLHEAPAGTALPAGWKLER